MTTDTQPLAPTDAELDELRQANSGKLNFVTLSEFRTIARAVLARWGAQDVPASQGYAQIAPADVLLRTAIAKTLYRQVRIEHDNRIGPWSAFDVLEQQRIVDSIQGLCSVFAPASQGDALDAARYRWLRERSSTMFVNISINGEGAEIAATLDSAVDAARKQGENHD